MGFNFNGMMQGLGGGLVATGQIMKEQEKMNWETEQLKLKYERDQHMQGLRLRAEAEGRQSGYTHSENLAKEQNRQADARWEKTEARGAAQDTATAEFRNRQLDMAAAEAKANAGARESTAKYQMAALEKETGAEKIAGANYDNILAVAADKFPDDKEKQRMFTYVSMNAKTDKGELYPPSVVEKAMDITNERMTALSADEDKFEDAKVQLGFGKLTNEQARPKMFELALQDTLAGVPTNNRGELSSSKKQQKEEKLSTPKADRDAGVMRPRPGLDKRVTKGYLGDSTNDSIQETLMNSQGF